MNLSGSAARRLASPASASQCNHASPRHRSLIPSFAPVFRVRRLESSAAPPPPDRLHLEQTNADAIVKQFPADPPPPKPPQNKARWPERVRPGDLQKTLEVHRAANRDSLIRRTPTRGKQDAHHSGGPKPPAGPPRQTIDSESPTDSELDALIDRVAEKRVLSQSELERILSAMRTYRADSKSKTDAVAVASLCRVRGKWRFPRQLRADQERTASPWASVSSYDITQSRVRVEQELRAFTSYLQPTEHERQLAAELYDYVAGKIGRELATVQIQAHGSRVTGLAHAGSDVDICLSHTLFHQAEGRGPSASHPQARNFGARALERLRTIFDGDGRIEFRDVVPARVPVARMHDKYSGLQIQVAANVTAGAAVAITKNLVQSHAQAVPIFMILRQAFQMRGLTKVVWGYLGSYQLFSMVVAALNHDPAPSPHLAVAFEKVLKFWADADLGFHGFTVEPQLVFSKWDTNLVDKLLHAHPNDSYLQGVANMVEQNKSQLKAYSTSTLRRQKGAGQSQIWHEGLLTLQDAANPFNDLGSKSHKIQEVLAVWRILTKQYLSGLRKWRNLSEEQRSTSDRLLLEPFIMGNYTTFDGRRSHVARLRLYKDRVAGTSVPTVDT